MDNSKLALGIAWYVIFVLSTVLHEASHALVGKMGGDTTAENQVTLDPMPHILREPIGLVVVPIVMFLSSGFMMGWASAPYDPMWASRNPHKAARMALAGPMANLLLAVIGGVALKIGITQGWFVGAEGTNGAVAFTLLMILYKLNVILFVFNLMPFPPLDGSSAISLLMPESTARTWQDQMRNPYLSMVTFMMIFVLFPEIGSPVLKWALHLLVPS